VNAVELEEAVQAGIEAGYSNRRIAAELGVERGRVDRCVARLKKRHRAAEASDQEQTDPSSLEQMIAQVDEQLRVAISTGNQIGAQRLTKVRENLIAQRPPEIVHIDDGADWTRLSPAARSALEHLVHIAHGFPGNPYWTELLERVAVQDDKVHPAYVPLPAGAPEGERLLVP
jgi:hypothetical protein